MIASLPMYDRPETREANDRLWSNIHANLAEVRPDAPPALTRDGDPWPHWLSPTLLLSQTCGLPYRQRLKDVVTLVAAPVHDLGDPPGQYHSVLIARASDTRDAFTDFEGARLAVNDLRSQSGWAAPQVMARDAGFVFADILTTGSHMASAMAVAMKAADIAAIDVVSWTIMERHDDFTRQLSVIDRTPSTPALPYVTSRPEDAPLLREALASAIAALTQQDRDTLCLHGVEAVERQDYLVVPSP
jgi:ABC-type phosphate/phosphonate transport system substrate-binding protein